ncbi:hypothetical protein L198_05786 [Cryptococcus wingfieldii CBS 7118]|uniref:Uncharacterized protein n=1 Tax=Cryptococcus wingfieldii CBS 7118 TaxID=1295528 RepID=A0A1E3IU22_9TREE|nr:hypothetical protein L198_05786 [Cryptococcus wingfieldii CBS 7118]ODN92114.1 hypothetical protein L198_05786 [Cryptococcus wingfieldii CBS 7118]
MSSDPLRRARYLYDDATAPNSSPEIRRQCHSALIALPSVGSSKAKHFFGSNVSTFFAEFEDLQDQAIDALLDLCEDEDEDMRIVGIKGLGPTARADPRWIKGNTGVLLQLLASQPRELEAVTKALVELLFIAPLDVFSVMADDCKGSEAETGASRDNILRFLKYQGAPALKKLLHSGNHRNAEERFRNEFEGVLSSGGLGLEEKVTVINLLVPLSTVSGANAPTESTNQFIKLLTDSIPSMTPIADKSRVTHIMKELVDRLHQYHPNNPPYDARYILYFFSVHGAGLTFSLFKPERDGRAKELLEGLKEWLAQAEVLWSFGQVRDPCLDKVRVAKGVIEQLWSGSSVNGKQIFGAEKVDRDTSALFEILFWSFYKLVTKPDIRALILPDLLHVLDFRTLILQADFKSRNHPQQELWRNIHQFLVVLSNPAPPLVQEIFPSWRPQNPPQHNSFQPDANHRGRGQMPHRGQGRIQQQGHMHGGHRSDSRGMPNASNGTPGTSGPRNGFNPPSGPSKSHPPPGARNQGVSTPVNGSGNDASAPLMVGNGGVKDKSEMEVDVKETAPAPTRPVVVAEVNAVSIQSMSNTAGKRPHDALSQPGPTATFSKPPPKGPKAAILSTSSLPPASTSTAKTGGALPVQTGNREETNSAGRPAKKRKSEIKETKEKEERLTAPSGAVPSLLSRLGPRDSPSLPPTSAPDAPPRPPASESQSGTAPRPSAPPAKGRLLDRLDKKKAAPFPSDPSSTSVEASAPIPEPADAPPPAKSFSIRGIASNSPLPTPGPSPKPDEPRRPVSFLGAHKNSELSILNAAAQNKSRVTSSSAEERSRIVEKTGVPEVEMVDDGKDEPGVKKRGRGHRMSVDPPTLELPKNGSRSASQTVGKNNGHYQGGYQRGYQGGFGPGRR